MASIAEKKAMLSLSDGASVNLNKPIDIPSSVTDIMQITEPGWYRGSVMYRWMINPDPDGPKIVDNSNVKNTPAIKINDDITQDDHKYNLFVTSNTSYIFDIENHLFYGYINNNKIDWYFMSPLVKDWLDSTDSEAALSANCGRLLKEELDTKSINTHTHDALIRTKDLRDAKTLPSHYTNEFQFVGMKSFFAVNLGSTNSNLYAAVFGFNPWSDSTGTGSFEIAFAFDGSIWTRHQATNDSTDSFGKWYEIPIIETSMTDLTAGTSDLATGHLYFVYE